MSHHICHRCVYAGRQPAQGIMNPPLGWLATLTCVNRAGHEGRLWQVLPSGTCRNYRQRREPAVWTTPPEPADEEVRHIGLTRGYFAVVDAADYAWLSRYKWTALVAGSKVYAIRAHKGKTILMHREIMQPPDGLVVDHIDGNGLNNRRSNMRACTREQNLYNSRPRNKRSKHKGVRYCEERDNWIAEITRRGHKFHLGTFDDEIEAARAYDRRAVELFGAFARLNFPDERQPAGTTAVMGAARVE